MPNMDITHMLDMSPAVMRDWAMRVSQGDEITGLQLRNEILPDGAEPGPSGTLWARHKRGSHRTVTVHCRNAVYTQTFIKRDDGWSEAGSMKQPRHPTTGRFVPKAPPKQVKPKAGTPVQKPTLKSTKKQYS